MQSKITFSKESFANVWPEMAPLVDEQWKEVPNFGGGSQANVDEEKYRAIDSTGCLLIYCLRQDGVLKGYSVFFLTPSLETTGGLFARNCTLYLDKSLRGGTVSSSFIQAIEDDLEFEEAVIKVDYQFKADRVPKNLMDILGYTHTEVVYTKVFGD